MPLSSDFLNTAAARCGKSQTTRCAATPWVFSKRTSTLWQILARQGEIPASAQDASWQAMIKPFAHITSSAQAFDAGRASLDKSSAATGETRRSQDEIVELIAGPRQKNSEEQAHPSRIG